VRRGRIAAVRRIDANGVCIDTWVVPSCPTVQPRGTVLMIHGLWDSKALLLPLARKLAKAGFNCVLPDVRCHGWSTGRFVTYGYHEKHDLTAVMRSLAGEGLAVSPTYVLGFSVGGGIAPQFAAIWPDCRGLMLLAPVASARLIMRRMLKFAAPFKGDAACQRIIDRAGEIGHFDVDAASAIEAARSITCPAVVMHGLLDHTVPSAHGKAIFDALTGPKQFILVRWAGHNSLLWGRSNLIVRQLVAFSDTESGSPAYVAPLACT
jgi:pimeloyl-ACP methyl ester carboxylesterase